MHRTVFLLALAMGLVPMSAASTQQPPAGTYLAPNACWCTAGEETRYGLEVGYWDSNFGVWDGLFGDTDAEITTQLAMRFGLGFSQIEDDRVVSAHVEPGVGGRRVFLLAGPSLWVGEVAPRIGARASAGLHLSRDFSLAAVASWIYRLHSGVGAEFIITL